MWAALPGIALKLASWWFEKQAQKAEGEERTKREITVAAIAAEQANRKTASEERQARFEWPVFWWTWNLFAIPAGLWFGFGMLDSIDFFVLGYDVTPSVKALPPQLEQTYSTIVYAVFGAAPAAAGLQGALRLWSRK